MNWIDETKEKKDYKKWVGNPEKYYDIGMILFNLVRKEGLKRNHTFLDIGCGSLRVGKHLISYLDFANYYGLEPEKWLIDMAIKEEIGERYINTKCPIFSYNNEFDLEIYRKKFDFILANSIFIHASDEQIRKCIQQVSKVLADDGIFIFNFIEGKMNRNKKWIYPQQVTYTKRFIHYLLYSNNLKFEYINVDYPGEQIWLKVSKKV